MKKLHILALSMLVSTSYLVPSSDESSNGVNSQTSMPQSNKSKGNGKGGMPRHKPAANQGSQGKSKSGQTSQPAVSMSDLSAAFTALASFVGTLSDNTPLTQDQIMQFKQLLKATRPGLAQLLPKPPMNKGNQQSRQGGNRKNSGQSQGGQGQGGYQGQGQGGQAYKGGMNKKFPKQPSANMNQNNNDNDDTDGEMQSSM